MISVKYDYDCEISARDCWVGDVIPHKKNIVSIQADGDELNEILGQIENIPYSKISPVQTWYGDTAKFIGSVLRLDKPQHGKYKPEKKLKLHPKLKIGAEINTLEEPNILQFIFNFNLNDDDENIFLLQVDATDSQLVEEALSKSQLLTDYAFQYIKDRSELPESIRDMFPGDEYGNVGMYVGKTVYFFDENSTKFKVTVDEKV